MAFKQIPLLWWSAKGVIMGHVGNTAFLFGQKTHITRSCGWYSFFARGKNSYHHIWSTRLSCLLTPHTISNRQICQKEKCMINKLWYGNFHIIPHINLRHPYQPEGQRSSGWYGCWVDMGYDMKIWPSGWYGCPGLIWKLPYNNHCVSLLNIKSVTRYIFS